MERKRTGRCPVPKLQKNQLSYFGNDGNFANLYENPFDQYTSIIPHDIELPLPLEVSQIKFYNEILTALFTPKDSQEQLGRVILENDPRACFIIVDERNSSGDKKMKRQYRTQVAYAVVGVNGKFDVSPFINPVRDVNFYANKISGYILIEPFIEEIHSSRNIQSTLNKVLPVLTPTALTVVIEQYATNKHLPIEQFLIGKLTTQNSSRTDHRKILHPQNCGFSEATIRDDSRLPLCKIMESVRIQEVTNANQHVIYEDKSPYVEIPWSGSKEGIKKRAKTKERSQQATPEMIQKVYEKYGHNLVEGDVFDIGLIHQEGSIAELAVNMKSPHDGDRRTEWPSIFIDLNS